MTVTEAGTGNPLEVWEDELDTSSISSDSSAEYVERNADKARRRELLEEWVDTDGEDGEAGSQCESQSDSESNSESDDEGEGGAVRVCPPEIS
jgi:hypothetical protein